VEEIWIADTRPILIKYYKLCESIRKMAEETWIPDTRHILLKYEKISANTTKMAEETWIPDTRPILLKYEKISANTTMCYYLYWSRDAFSPVCGIFILWMLKLLPKTSKYVWYMVSKYPKSKS
jgi:hypothetical protein